MTDTLASPGPARVEEVPRNPVLEDTLRERGVALGPDLLVRAHATRLHLELDPTTSESITEVMARWLHEPSGHDLPTSGWVNVPFLDDDLSDHPDYLRQLAALFIEHGLIALHLLRALTQDGLLKDPSELVTTVQVAAAQPQ